MDSDKIKILLADDETLFRKGIRFLLESEGPFEIIHESENGMEVIDYLSQNDLPEIILMDLNMPELNGVETTKVIHEKYEEIKIIALSSYFSKPFILNMIQVGASSYLAKNATPDEVVKTILEVHTKGFYYNPEVMRFIHEDLTTPNNKISRSKFDSGYLTAREKEVLQLICEQYTTSEISEKLFISPRTVDGHRNNLLIKMESKNVAGLVVNAITNKLVTIQF